MRQQNPPVVMAKSPASSWSEGSSTIPPETPNTDDSHSYYSSDTESISDSLIATISSSASPPETPWIIEHILERRSADEQLPLRVMFSFNSGQGLPTLKDVHQWWHFRKDGQKIITFLSSLDKLDPPSGNRTFFDFSDSSESIAALADEYSSSNCPYDRFMDPGNKKLLQVPSSPNDNSSRRASQGLPPNFVEKMVLTTIFRSEIMDVDFKQALAGLDYLRDFEDTRRCCLREAAQRLGIKVDNWRNVLGSNERALEWVEDVLEKENAVEGFYSRIYVNLRIWTMIHELKEPIFYRPNLLAMLNTLFPPSIDDTANMPVKAQVLHKHRASMYTCLLDVESQAPHRRRRVVDSFVNRNLRVGTSYSWQETRAQLENYMNLAESMIRQAKLVRGVEFFNPHSSPYVKTSSTFEFAVSPPKPFPALQVDTSRQMIDAEGDLELFLPEPMPERPKIPMSSFMVGGTQTQKSQMKSRLVPQAIIGLNLIPERSPLRRMAAKKPSSTSVLPVNMRPRFRARCHSESTLLPPRLIREAANPLGSLLIFQTSDLRQMVLNAIRAATLEPPRLGPSANLYSLSPLTTTPGTKLKSLVTPSLTPSPLQASQSPEDQVRLALRDAGPETPPPVDPIDPFKPAHRRTNSAGKPFVMHRRTNSRGTFRRPFLRKDSSALRNVENAGSVESLEFPKQEASNTPQQSSELSPPKLNYQPSFRNLFQRRESEAAAYVEEKFPSFDNHRIPGTPSLRTKASFTHSHKDSAASNIIRPRNASFVRRPSTSMSKTRDPMSGYWPSPTNSSDGFPKLDRGNPLGVKMGSEKVVTPLQEFNDFGGGHTSPEGRTTPSLQKKSSFAHLERPSVSIESCPYDRPFSPASLERTVSNVPFCRTPTDMDRLINQGDQSLRKQRSFGFLEGRRSKKVPTAIHTSPTNGSSRPISPYVATPSPLLANPAQGKSELRKKSSLPSLRFRSGKRSPVVPPPEYLYYETNDPNERLIITRPETPFLSENDPPLLSPRSIASSATSKKLRKAKSATSLRSQETSKSTRSLFRKKSKEVVLTSADISEPFPSHLTAGWVRQNKSSEPTFGTQVNKRDQGWSPGKERRRPAWLAAGPADKLTEQYTPITEESYGEYRRKEYARRWYLEEARARRHDLHAPKGGPLGEIDGNGEGAVVDKERTGVRKVLGGKKIEGGLRAKTIGRPYEGVDMDSMPRATAKDLKRPERPKLDGIFGMKFGKGKEKQKLGYVAMNVGKYERI